MYKNGFWGETEIKKFLDENRINGYRFTLRGRR